MDTKKTLMDFTNHCCIPGVQEGIDFAVKLLEPYGKVRVSPLGSVICTVSEPKSGEPHILLDAHIDEIGFLVTYIEDNGFLRLGQFGGTDARLLASSRVVIHAKDRKIDGVICSTPPHLTTASDKKAPSADEVFVDTGLTTEQAGELISPGDRVSFCSPTRELLNNHLVGKAMDDHAGCVSLLKALDYLDFDFDYGLTVTFSTMEEIGGMGAQTSAFEVSPTLAITVDVGFGDSYDTPKHQSAKLSHGPAISFSPILSHKMSNQLIETAKKHNIPYSTEVGGGKTHTNADSIACSKTGIPTALLSIPLRYMHMPIELLNVDDVENTGRLIASFLKEMQETGEF